MHPIGLLICLPYPCNLIPFPVNEGVPRDAHQLAREGLACATSLIRGTTLPLAMDHAAGAPLIVMSTMPLCLYIQEIVIHPRAGCACDLGLWMTLTRQEQETSQSLREDVLAQIG